MLSVCIPILIPGGTFLHPSSIISPLPLNPVIGPAFHPDLSPGPAPGPLGINREQNLEGAAQSDWSMPPCFLPHTHQPHTHTKHTPAS